MKFLYLIVCTCLLSSVLSFKSVFSQVIPVTLTLKDNGSWELLRNGQPYRIKGGATSNTDRFNELRNRGGNSVRTWGVDSGTQAVLDSAHAQGISVMLGLWIGRERDGFNYNDPEKVAEQLQHFTTIVLQYKDHPALLAWGIGNEANLGYSNVKVWDAVNDISRMIHELDGNHPTATVTAGISTQLANELAQRCYDIDFLGVNSYGGISGVQTTLRQSDWDKPYVLTEWGINGPWETNQSGWGAPIEPTSTQKAFTFKNRYELFIASNQTDLLGSYAFLWNEKEEATLTWFGLFVGQSTTPMIDELQKQWSNSQPENVAPVIEGWTFADQGQKTSYRVFRSKNNLLEIEASDPDGDQLTYEYLIRPEDGSEGIEDIPDATYPAIPGIIDHQDGEQAKLTFNSSQNEKQFRLYVLIRDGKGHVATLTLPLLTDLVDLQAEYEFLPIEDAYVRNGIFQDSLLGVYDQDHLKVCFSKESDEISESYLLFDLNQAPPEYTSVSLELFGSSTLNATIQLWGFGGHFWKEEKLVWENRLIPGSGVIAQQETPAIQPGYFSWDLTDFIEKQFTQKNKILTMVLRPAKHSDQDVIFFSKEKGENPPRIVFNTVEQVQTIDASDRFILYPNPASTKINFLMDQELDHKGTITLYSEKGIVVVKASTSGYFEELDISGLPAGKYFIVWQSDLQLYRVSGSFIKI